MAVGIQVFNSSGSLTFDSTDGTSRIIGEITINAASGNASLSGMGTGGRLFAFWGENNFGETNAAFWPDLYIQSGRVYWTEATFPRSIIIGETNK